MEEEKVYTYVQDIEFEMTLEDANCGCHIGSCDEDVQELVDTDYIREQLDRLDTEVIRENIRAYGLDDVDEMDRHRLECYLVWIAAGNIVDDDYSKSA